MEAPQPKRVERVLFVGDSFSATLTRAGESALRMEVDSVSTHEMFPPQDEHSLLREELSILLKNNH